MIENNKLNMIKQLFDRAIAVWKEHGFITLIIKCILFLFRHIHKYLRPIVPNKEAGRINGISVCGLNTKYGDDIVPWSTPGARPKYKTSEYDVLRKYVQEGDEVTIIGSAYGANIVVVAEIVGNSGRVTCYEGNPDRCSNVRETLEINNINCEVINGFIYSDLQNESAYEEIVKESQVIHPSSIKTGNVINMDVQGAEYDIIKGFSKSNLPETLIVQSHHHHDFSSFSQEELLSLINEKGYTLVEEFSGPWVSYGYVFQLNSDRMEE